MSKMLNNVKSIMNSTSDQLSLEMPGHYIFFDACDENGHLVRRRHKAFNRVIGSEEDLAAFWENAKAHPYAKSTGSIMVPSISGQHAYLRMSTCDYDKETQTVSKYRSWYLIHTGTNIIFVWNDIRTHSEARKTHFDQWQFIGDSIRLEKKKDK